MSARIIRLMPGCVVPTGARFLYSRTEVDKSRVCVRRTERPIWFGFGIQERTVFYHPAVVVFYYEEPAL